MKKSHRPITRVKNQEQKAYSSGLVIWVAWTDQVTFEDIRKLKSKLNWKPNFKLDNGMKIIYE